MDETHGLVEDTRPRALALLALAPRVTLELARARILLARLDARMIPRLNALVVQTGDTVPGQTGSTPSPGSSRASPVVCHGAPIAWYRRWRGSDASARAVWPPAW